MSNADAEAEYRDLMARLEISGQNLKGDQDNELKNLEDLLDQMDAHTRNSDAQLLVATSGAENALLRSRVDTGAITHDHEDMNAPTREEIDEKIGHAETRLGALIAGGMHALELKFVGLESKLAGLDTKFASIDTKLAQSDSAMHKNTSELVRWIVGTAIGLGAVGLAVMTFVLNNAVPKAPTSAAPQPIIVYAQPAPASAPIPAPPPPAKHP